MSEDTIFALASGHGKSGVAVIRISGPLARAGVSRLCEVPEPRVARLRKLVSTHGDFLDEAIVVFFPQNQSFTGEETVELHIHGGTATIKAVVQELANLAGFRLARPGEFTRRALLNGRLDLTAVEGLADLIDAETDLQRRQALRMAGGHLFEKSQDWRQKLIKAASLLMAAIDFSDEEIPPEVILEARSVLVALEEDLTSVLQGSRSSERVRTGFEVAIVGPPNAGKSTLLNAIAGREAAITSEIAGTTRDVIEVRLDLDGIPVTMLDTAGIRASTDLVESIGIERTKQRAESADIRVFLSTDEKGADDALFIEKDIRLFSKTDITGKSPGISGKTGEGVADLLERISGELRKRVPIDCLLTRERHIAGVSTARDAIEAAIHKLESGETDLDIASEMINSALRSLDSLIGNVGVENVLDEVFSSFCLGK